MQYTITLQAGIEKRHRHQLGKTLPDFGIGGHLDRGPRRKPRLGRRLRHQQNHKRDRSGGFVMSGLIRKLDPIRANLAESNGAGLMGANAYQTQDAVNQGRVSVKRFGADGAGATTTVTATGASLGDGARAAFSQPLLGVMVNSWVNAADVVSVRF